MESIALAESLGLVLPSPLYLLGAVLFGLVGLVAFRQGRRQGAARLKWLGLVLMFYPYAVTQTWALYVLGAALCLCFWRWRV